MGVPVPQLMEAVVEVTPLERVQNRTPQQIVGVHVPQIMEARVDVMLITPQERVQNRTLEQIVDVPVPRTMEAIVKVVPSPPQERVQNCTPEQIVDVPFLRTMEVRVPSCIQEQIMDLLVPQIMVASKPFTGKASTVDMRHHRGDQACPVDTVGLNIKGLDRYTLLRSGDFMVPALPMEIPVPQIAEEIVERTLPLVHEAARKFFEQHTLEDGLISCDSGLFRALRQRAFEKEAEEEEEEEEDEVEGGILASS